MPISFHNINERELIKITTFSHSLRNKKNIFIHSFILNIYKR